MAKALYHPIFGVYRSRMKSFDPPPSGPFPFGSDQSWQMQERNRQPRRGYPELDRIQPAWKYDSSDDIGIALAVAALLALVSRWALSVVPVIDPFLDRVYAHPNFVWYFASAIIGVGAAGLAKVLFYDPAWLDHQGAGVVFPVGIAVAFVVMFSAAILMSVVGGGFTWLMENSHM